MVVNERAAMTTMMIILWTRNKVKFKLLFLTNDLNNYFVLNNFDCIPYPHRMQVSAAIINPNPLLASQNNMIRSARSCWPT